MTVLLYELTETELDAVSAGRHGGGKEADVARVNNVKIRIDNRQRIKIQVVGSAPVTATNFADNSVTAVLSNDNFG